MTSTRKLGDALFPAASVVVHVTVVEPRGNTDPGGQSQETGTSPSTASCARGLDQETAAPVLAGPSTVMLSGKDNNIGAVVSLTVTMNVALAELP